MALPSSSSSSSSSSITRSIKYDVFLSFRGEDTRQNFTSHLQKALLEKKIETFIDYKLNRGDEISPSLLQAIEESQISIIVFSKGYASSNWCLEELENILECKEKYKQIVIPIFYEVDPSDVRNQKGSFADAFDKHGERFKDSLDKVQRWKDALKKAADLSGFDSRVIKPESDLIETIILDVQKRLDAISSSTDNDYLIGIDSKIQLLQSLLENETKDAYVVGIWGMGGIGKTTLARALLNKMSSKFEGSYFVPDVREASEQSGGLNHLRQELMSDILRDKNGNIGTCSLVPTFMKKRLARYKLFIVFDDVTNFKQIESLIGSPNCLNSESRIIITSRDKQVLKNCSVNKIFEVEELSLVDALRIFRWHAFRKNSLMVDYERLSKQIVTCVGGIPLALEVLGCSMFGKGKLVWESAINKLENILHKDIYKVLKISYEGLDYDQQNIFLDIACFFNGWEVDFVKCFLDASGFFAKVGISDLIDKSLITLSNNKRVLRMHDLLQAMGRKIVQEESIDDPARRSRLWDHDEIYDILTKNTGTEKIVGISLNMSKIRDIHLHPCALARMQKLRFLRFYSSNNKVHLCHSLKSVFTELRYLHWQGCPLKSLQSNIQPEKLVKLDMPASNVENLWSGVQQLANLKTINFRGSEQLKSFPDLSKAQNLKSLNLCGCKSLLAIPDCRDLKSLTILCLSDCLKLKTLPELPHNLQELYADNTPIEELPSSIEVLTRLRHLCLDCCSKLKCLPSSVSKLKSLKHLGLSGCSKLDKLPDDIGTLNSLTTFYANGTVIRELPSSVTCLKNLETLYFAGIQGQDTMEHLSPLLLGFRNLTTLGLPDCGITEVPEILFSCLSSLEELCLSRNNFESIPASIINLPYLNVLDITSCKRLKFLPELPLMNIYASDCTSLEVLSCFEFQESNIETIDYLFMRADFKYCFNFCPSILKDALWKVHHLATYIKDFEDLPLSGAQFCYPGNEIPEWFSYQNTGSNINVKFPPDWFNHNFVGFALCAVVLPGDHRDNNGDFIDICCDCTLKSKDGNPCVVSGVFGSGDYDTTEYIGRNHVHMGFDFIMYPRESLYYDNEVSFRFYFDNEGLGSEEHHKVEKCGVLLMYAPHLEESDGSLATVGEEDFLLEQSDGSLGISEEEDEPN